MASRPRTMHAWQKIYGSSEPVRNEVPVPSAPSDGLLIKIHAAGVCHSDFGLLKQDNKGPNFPEAYTLGHEGSGEVVEIGSSVPKDAFKVGDMVAILSVAGCGNSTCGQCKRDLAQICRTGEKYGIITHDGSYAPYIAIKARAAAKLPPGVTPEQGAVATDACMTAYHAVVGTGGVKKDETVLVVGIGGLGFNALQIVQGLGARVIVADTRQEPLDEALKFGVPKIDIVPVGEAVPDFVQRNHLEIDTVIDFAGVPETFNAAQEAGECRNIHQPCH